MGKQALPGDHFIDESKALKTAGDIGRMLQQRANNLNGFTSHEDAGPAIKAEIEAALKENKLKPREITHVVMGGELRFSVGFSFPGNEIVDHCRVIKNIKVLAG